MRLCWWTAVVFSVLLCHQAAAQTAVQDRQAIYDQAQAAYDQHDWAASSVGFARLLPAGAQPLRRSEAVIASRLATALLHLDRLDEAQAWADRAVAAMPPSEPALVEEALLVEADVARARYDYPAAIKAYDQADALMAGQGVSDQLFRERMGLGFAGVTVDPAHVLKQLTAMSDDPSFSKTVNKQVLAQVEDLEARAAVNLGDTVTAARLIRSAVSDSGGLTTGKVSTSQVALRADAGIISRLRHDDEATHRYLAYTGAGHLEDMSWILDRSGELPVCDDVGDGVRSDDSVVITFAIADDGRVVGALPIYASRTGRLGETFARAVSTWRWDPDAIKKVDPFWRATLQLELRCVSRPRPAELGRSIQNEGVSWLRRHGVIDTAELASLKEGYVISVPAADPRRTGPDRRLVGVEIRERRIDRRRSETDRSGRPFVSGGHRTGQIESGGGRCGVRESRRRQGAGGRLRLPDRSLCAGPGPRFDVRFRRDTGPSARLCGLHAQDGETVCGRPRPGLALFATSSGF
jgi:hypothetical protein